MARRRIDWPAVAIGALLAVAVLAVTIAAVAVLDLAGGSNWLFALYAVALAGLAAGGRLAAVRRPDAPLAHGLLAALLAYGVVAAVAVAARLVLDRGLDVVALTFNALMAASAGILGTVVAERWPGDAP